MKILIPGNSHYKMGILPPNSLDKANETFHFVCSDLYDTTFPKRVVIQTKANIIRRIYLKTAYKRCKYWFEKIKKIV